MHNVGTVTPEGALGIQVFRPIRPQWWKNLREHALPHRGLPREVNRWRVRNLWNLWRGFWRVALAYVLGIPTVFGALYIDVLRKDGTRVRYGMASLRVVTTVGAGFLVDAWQNIVELEIMKYHGIGTGGTAEAAGDTALVTESTTALNPDSTRATGTTTEASATVFRSVGTLTADAAIACTEHGLFSQAATGGGVLMDRSLFSVINLANGDSIQTTYDFTVSTGG